jgi:hypothetical protein
LGKVLRQVVPRAAVLLQLGKFAPIAAANIPAKIAVEVLDPEHAGPITGFDVPHHTARLPVAACPLLDNGSTGLRAVADIQTHVRVQVSDQIARGPFGDATPAWEPPLIVVSSVTLRLELVPLYSAIDAAARIHNAAAASALLDQQAVRIAWAPIWGRLETLAAHDTDQWHMLVIIQGDVGSSWARQDKDDGSLQKQQLA